ncbi:MAG: hypothetical protein NTZ59_05295 [Bacteroidetes bacterium]|nr:hypothetical protein [Bacteroidota bacterium]
MKKIFLMAIVAASIVSCKKDDGGNGNTSVNVPITGYKLDSGIISIPSASASLALDYSNANTAKVWNDTQRIATNPSFVGATYMTSASTSLLGQTIGISTYYKKDATIWNELGDDFGNNVNLSLAGISATIANGAMVKNPVLKLANFPLNYNDSFQSNASSSLNLNATYGGATIPVTVNLATTGKSKNIATGTLKLNGYSGTMNVVIQKYTRTVATSVSTNPLFQSTLNGLLNSYGFTNGQQTVTLTEYRYWVNSKGFVMTLYANGQAYVTAGL